MWTLHLSFPFQLTYSLLIENTFVILPFSVVNLPIFCLMWLLLLSLPFLVDFFKFILILFYFLFQFKTYLHSICTNTSNTSTLCHEFKSICTSLSLSLSLSPIHSHTHTHTHTRTHTHTLAVKSFGTLQLQNVIDQWEVWGPKREIHS